MLRVVSDGLWSEVRKLARGKVKFAAIAYVTTDRDLKFGDGDVLVCDASDAAIEGGLTSCDVLRAAMRRGASVYSSPGLHAKAMVLGRVAIVGSANMSNASASQLDEVAIITDDARAVAGVRVLVHQLAERADVVDEAFLERASKLRVRSRARGSRRRGRIKLRSPRAWFVALHPLDEERFRREAKLVDAEQRKAEASTEYRDSDAGYMRWTGNSRFRLEAMPGDVVIAVWTPTAKSRRGRVYAPEPILHRRDVGNVTHFFVEEYADREDTAIPFSTFKRLWRRTGGSSTMGVNSTREVPIDLLESARGQWGAYRQRQASGGSLRR